MYKNNVEGWLTRDLMFTLLALAALLLEFHVNSIMYSSGEVRLVRLLVITDVVLQKEKKERSSCYEKHFGFLNIAGAASSATQFELDKECLNLHRPLILDGRYGIALMMCKLSLSLSMPCAASRRAQGSTSP